MIIRLQWPSLGLSPNARLHWAAKANAVKWYRRACEIDARAQGVKPVAPGFVALSVTFHPPDNRPRNHDNLIASMKAGQDGLADAMRIDDKWFRVTWEPIGPVFRGGLVVVTLP